MLAKVVYGAGRFVAGLTGLGVIVAIFLPAETHDPGASSSAVLYWTIALAVVGVPAAVAIHEAGHAVACLALGAQIRAVYLGSGESTWLRFTVSGVKVSLGNPYMGRVEHEIASSVARGAFITAAGSLTNFIVAGALLAAAGPGDRGIAGLALLIWLFGVIGIYLGFILQMFLRMAFFRWAAHKRWHARLPWQGSLAGLLLASVGFVLSLRI